MLLQIIFILMDLYFAISQVIIITDIVGVNVVYTCNNDIHAYIFSIYIHTYLGTVIIHRLAMYCIYVCTSRLLFSNITTIAICQQKSMRQSLLNFRFFLPYQAVQALHMQQVCGATVYGTAQFKVFTYAWVQVCVHIYHA